MNNDEKPQTVMPGYLGWVALAVLMVGALIVAALVLGGLDLGWHILKWIFG